MWWPRAWALVSQTSARLLQRPAVQQLQTFRRTHATGACLCANARATLLITRMSSPVAGPDTDVALVVDTPGAAHAASDRAALAGAAIGCGTSPTEPVGASPPPLPTSEARHARDSTPPPDDSVAKPTDDFGASTACVVSGSDSGDFQPSPSVRLLEENSSAVAAAARLEAASDRQPPDLTKRSRRKMKRRQLHAGQATESAADAQNGGDDDEEPAEKRWRADADAGFGREVFSETEYYFENGLRKVYPYHYTYLTHCKGRWVGRNILDVFAAEYRNSTPEQHAKSIASGRLKINGHMVEPDYAFKGCNELVSNLVHRHEVPISAAPIQIVSLTEDLVVINKPSSMPVHPCGRYRHNSVAFILGREHGLQNLRTLYRLDRLTSGVLIMARTHATAERMVRQMNERKVSKVYVCRVDGEFPSIAECKEPMDRVHHALGTWRVKPGGKPSHTSFERMSFNGKTSVVKCYPHTGRTHQIRVHLQYLGYPITNDPLYNHPVWGPCRGKGCDYGKSGDQLYRDLLSVHTVENYTELVEVAAAADDGGLGGGGSPPRDPASTFDSSKLIFDADCDQCRIRYKDPRPEELIMYLHALSYKGPDWEFYTDLPDWAKDDWQS